MLYGRLYGETIQQKVELLHAYVLAFVRSPGPLEVTHGSSFVKQKESVAFPYKSLESVCFLSAEKIQNVRNKYAATVFLIDYSGKAFYSESKVGVSADDIYFFETGYIPKHWKPP